MRRSLRDMFVVVASILIAFSLDAWWDGHLERNDERSKLIGLRAEFDTIAAQLRVQALSHSRVAAAADSLLVLTGPVVTAQEAAEVPRLFTRALIPHTLDVSSGTVKALLAGGKLEVIRNAELRRALAAWEGNLQDATEDEGNAREHLFDLIVPLMADQTQLRATLNFDQVTSTASRFVQAPAALLRDPRFASALQVRAHWLRHVVKEIGDVEREARRIGSLVQSELER